MEDGINFKYVSFVVLSIAIHILPCLAEGEVKRSCFQAVAAAVLIVRMRSVLVSVIIK